MTNADPNGLLNLDGGATPPAGSTTTPPSSTTTPPPSTTPPAGSTPPSTTPPSSTTPPASQDFKSTWKEYIPEDLKDRAEWNNIKDPSDLFKNYINAQQTISKSVRLPDEQATPEDIAAFYTKLGKPAKKEDYTFEYQAKEGDIYTKDSFDFSMFQDIADKANLTKKQYQALASAYIDINNANYKAYNQGLADKAAEELKTAESKLKNAWGTQYNNNINLITEKVKKLYSKDTLNRMQNAGLFRDADFLETHLKLTKMMTGDTVFIEGNAVENVPQTLQTLQQKRDTLMQEDYSKNRDAIMNLNKQIVQLKQSQTQGAAKFLG